MSDVLNLQKAATLDWILTNIFNGRFDETKKDSYQFADRLVDPLISNFLSTPHLNTLTWSQAAQQLSSELGVEPEVSLLRNYIIKNLKDNNDIMVFNEFSNSLANAGKTILNTLQQSLQDQYSTYEGDDTYNEDDGYYF